MELWGKFRLAFIAISVTWWCKIDYSLNGLYKTQPALHENNLVLKVSNGLIIQIIKMQLCFIRKGDKPKDDVIVVCNFTQIVRNNYKLAFKERKVNWDF
jgi:1,4-alpha-glucan branching enzyme